MYPLPLLWIKRRKLPAVAQQLEKIVNSYRTQGWVYVRLESVSTYVQPDPGCFGFGAKPGYLAAYQMVVFSKI
ncbi:hypothetical protein [Pedobacter sp. N23S346]|uniref:hypothetical protein n=1 Tax=Pedobacter sp. N23S346 TaxID=3402750 RepID=UPI003AD58527